MQAGSKAVSVQKISNTASPVLAHDVLAVEEPLEIRLGYELDGQRKQQSISITMRTPGNDFDLAAGFLFTEGIVQHAHQIADVQHCGGQGNIVKVELAAAVEVDFARLQRHFYTSSSCGVCGKTSIEALHANACPLLPPASWQIDAAVIHDLPAQLRAAQAVFETTGGLHAAALFQPTGELVALREDVGRHNAVDKLIGAELQAGRTPLHNQVLLVSGRASFELVQKALMGGIPMLAAVGAPSSLAVELAGEFGMTLIGFVRDERFNIYCGAERIQSPLDSRQHNEQLTTDN